MIKKRYVLPLLFIIGGMHDFMQCHGVIGAHKLLDLMKKEGTKKEDILSQLSKITKGSNDAKNILEYGDTVKDYRFKGDRGVDDTRYYLLEYIFFKLPSDLEKHNPQKKGLSLDDLLEISEALWNLHPQCASTLKAFYDGKTTNTKDPHAQPLIHSLIDEYFKVENGLEKRVFFKKFIDFIIEKHPKTLSVTDGSKNTVLHNLLCYAGGGKLEEPELVNELIEKIVTAGGTLDAQTSSNKTALHLALLRRALSSAQMLLTKGANPLLKDEAGENAVQHILEDREYSTNEELVFTLLNHNKIDSKYLTHLRTKKGQSIAHIVAQLGSQKCVDLLKKKGVALYEPAFHGKDIFGKTPRNYAEALPDQAIRDAITSLFVPEKTPPPPAKTQTAQPPKIEQEASSPSPSVEHGDDQASNYTPWVIGCSIALIVVGMEGIRRGIKKLKQEQLEEQLNTTILNDGGM